MILVIFLFMHFRQIRTMNTVRISKIFSFEAAHFLPEYNGACRNIHGHSYELTVTLKGQPQFDEGASSNGMLMDFSILGKIVKQEIISLFDHALIVRKGSNISFSTKLLEVNYTPTCENLIIDIAHRLQLLLPPNVKLFSLLLHETKNNFCEWYAEDNLLQIKVKE